MAEHGEWCVGEDECHECGSTNPVWYAPSEDWNLATAKIGREAILCPSCFIFLYERATGEEPVWIVRRQVEVDFSK